MCEFNFAKTICWSQFECSEEWAPDSVINLGCDVNIKSIEDNAVFYMYVGSLVICYKPNCAVTFSIAFPSWLDCHDNTNVLNWYLNLQLT